MRRKRRIPLLLPPQWQDLALFLNVQWDQMRPSANTPPCRGYPIWIAPKKAKTPRYKRNELPTRKTDDKAAALAFEKEQKETRGRPWERRSGSGEEQKHREEAIAEAERALERAEREHERKVKDH